VTLSDQKCEVCRTGTPPLSLAESRALAREVPGWALAEKSIEREFGFQDFHQAIGFVNRVADLAEQEGHHPDISISYNRVRLKLWTHKIGGLSRNDFILAAKVDRLAESAG